jgi:hypothetical protein
VSQNLLSVARKAIVGLLCIASQAAAQTVISTTGGGTPLSPFGKPDAQTFGQTFTTPTDNFLQGFTFYMTAAPSLTFRAYVFEWDVALGRATGSALYMSNPIIGPLGFDLGFIAVPVNVGGLSLNPGNPYVAFFSSSGQGTLGEIALQSAWDSPAANQYSGGAFVYLNNGENTGAFTTQSWSTDRQGPGSDARFTMVFTTTTPEPSTLALVFTAALSVGGLRFARRRIKASQGSHISAAD